MVRTCCVKLCKSESYAGCGISFFGFPSNENLQKQWLEVVQIKKSYSKSSVICSQHFKPEDIIIYMGKCTLKPDVTPSIFPVEEKHSSVSSNIGINPSVEESVQVSQHELPQGNVKPIAIYSEKENLDLRPGTSSEPQSEIRHNEAMENLICEKNQLQYKVKLLLQCLKRRDAKIYKLKTALKLIKKECSNFEVESVLENNFSNIHKHVNTKKSDKAYSDDIQ